MTATPPSACGGCGATHWRRSNRCWECLERELFPYLAEREPEPAGQYVTEHPDILSALVAKEEVNLGKDYDE